MDFTPWLAEEDNLTLLADAVGLEITVDETESSVGDFNVDIYAMVSEYNLKLIGKKLLQKKLKEYIKLAGAVSDEEQTDIIDDFELPDAE